MTNKALLALSILTGFGAATPAFAQDGSGFSVSGGATLVSDYRFRGISLSDEDVALQGTLNLNHDSGFYAGAWASSLDDTPLYGEVELDLYAGWTKEVASGTSVDVGLLYYVYPDGTGDSDYFEPYAKVSHTIGPVKGTVGLAYAWDQSAIGNDDNIYVFADLAAGIPGTPVTLKAHAGHSDGSLSPTGNYWDWSVGAEAAVGPVTVGVAYVDTDLGDFRNVDAGLVASVGFAF